MNEITIRTMQAADLDFAAGCTAGEGWISETRAEFEGFWQHFPAGCLVVEAPGERVGIGVATAYGEYGFVGELIVARSQRGSGIGARLLDQAVACLRDHGAQSIDLDGVIAAVSLYERAGFRKICRSLRFYGRLPGREHPAVRPMQAQDMEPVSRLDREAFGANRRFFLERRLSLYPDLCHILELDGAIAGYIFGRRGNGLISAGPWYVRPGVDHPAALLESLALRAGETRIGLGVLETNTQAVALIRSLGLNESPTPPWRMVLGPSERLGASPCLYAVGSAAKG